MLFLLTNHLVYGMYMCVYMCVDASVRPEVDANCLPLLIFALLFETGSSSEPRTCGYLGSNSGPLASTASILPAELSL